MSWEDCVDTIRAASGRDMSKDEIHTMLEDVRLRAERMRRERIDLSEAELIHAAAAEAKAEADMAARIEARNRKMNLLKRIERQDFYERAPAVGKTPGIVMGVEAKLVGVNTPFAGGRLSVAAQALALKRDLLGGMVAEIDRAGLFGGVRSGAMDRDIARELAELNKEAGNPGVTGVKAAAEAAAIIQKYQRLAVELLNREGAWIGQYDGYIARTAHDPDKIRRAGYETWKANAVRGLDERTFDGIEDRERFLRGVWSALVTGVHLTPEGVGGFKDPAFTGPANTAKKLSQGRVLHWKDADAWMDYQQAFGQGRLMDGIVHTLNHAAGTIALMREFGTNPRAEFDADIQRLKETWRDRDPEAVVALTQAERMLSNRFKELDGSTAMPVNRLAARIGAGIRTWNAMSKLGGVLLSALTDVPLKAKELRYNGVNLLQGYWDGVAALTRGRGTGEEREVMDLLRAGLDGMWGDIAGRIDPAGDSVPGTLSKVANLFFRVSGLTYWTDAQRAGAEFVLSRHLGSLAGHGWDALPHETRRVLTLFDIGGAEWEAVRGAEMVQADGRAFVTPDVAHRLDESTLDGLIGDKLAAIRDGVLERLERGAAALDRLETRFGKLMEALDRALPTLDDAERRRMRGTVDGWRRQADTVSRLRDELRRHDRGETTANTLHKRLVRELGTLARAERKIAAEAERQAIAITERVPKAEAARAEAEEALRAVQQEMVRRIEELDGLPERLERQVEGARAKARDDLALKLHAYFADRGEYAVLAPGVRERAMLRRGTEPGTPEGEALRFIGQFKAFPVAMISKVWGREVYGGDSGATRAAGMVHLMVATTVFGYLAMSLKDLAKGRTPRDPANPLTWGAAFAQGGALGIYGDYLVGDYSRFGRSMLSSLAGPTFGQIDDVAELWNRVKAGDDVAAAALRFGLSNTPFLNLFYTRVGLDYLFLYQVQEALNPGFLRRFERRIREQNNQSFILSPARAIPHGGGNRLFEGVR